MSSHRTSCPTSPLSCSVSGCGQNGIRAMARIILRRDHACAADSNAPFFDKCAIGLSDSMRGFSPTEFIDTRLVSAQVELRQRLGRRIGFVAFGGIGDSYANLSDNGSHSAIGAGLRYRVSRNFRRMSRSTTRRRPISISSSGSVSDPKDQEGAATASSPKMRSS